MGEKTELCLTSELSLNNSITTSTRTLDTMDSTTSLFRHQSSLQHSQDTDKHSRQRKIAALILFQLLITTVSVTAVVLAAIAFSNYYDVMHNDDTDIKTLENRIMTLERMLNQSTDNQTDTECANPQCITHQAISETIENFTIILYKQLHINFSYTESQINKVSTEIMDHLRDQIGQLNTTVDINLERIMSVNHTLNMLSSQVQDATQRDMNTTANLYDNCIVDHEMCSGGQLSNIYWRVCATSYLPLNVTVSYQTRYIM